MEETKTTITIDIEEYKELLIIKGRYEELKERHIAPIALPTYRGNDKEEILHDYNKITCKLAGDIK